MKIEWEMSIGYPGARREGEVEIDDKELAGLSRDQINTKIDEAIWEDAVQYVDAYPTNTADIAEQIDKLIGGGKGE
ncbi:DUF7167 family protein [Paenibacillus sp. NPDC055715]